MSERVYTYEGMFLFPQSESSNLDRVVEHVQEVLDRAGAELLAMSKWGERNLAFPIEKNKRGLYILAYFKVEGGSVVGIERDCNLSESIIRYIITRADHMTVEDIAAKDGRESLRTETALKAEGGSAEPESESKPKSEPVAAAAAAETSEASKSE